MVGKALKISGKTISLMALLGALCSFVFNVSTWHIWINEEKVMSSWDNEMGEIIKLKKEDVQLGDTLKVARYLCGYNAENSTSSIIVKTRWSDQSKTYVNKNQFLDFSASFPMMDLLQLQEFKNTDVFEIYFTIDDDQNNYHNKVLIAKIELIP